MKELSIEEKAKRYDDLLVKLQEAKVDNNVCDDRYCCVIDVIVPELKESEGERIRKELIEFVKSRGGFKQEYIAWLEKKAEQKPAGWSEEDEAIYYGVIETEQYMLDVVNGIKEFSVGSISIKEECTKELNWLKSLKDRVQPQPKQEWSEEDEYLFQVVIDILERVNYWGNVSHTDLIACVRKLKSLRPQKQDVMSEDEFRHIVGYLVQDIVANEHMTEADKQPTKFFVEKYYKKLRPQSTWKPSDEQMKALESIFAKHGAYDDDLLSLIGDLKKLKDEK